MSPAWQRRGLMLEAVHAVIDRLFSQENTDYIHCGYLSYNVPSKMLQEKLGFQEMFTEHFSLDGREIEVVENVLWKADF